MLVDGMVDWVTIGLGVLIVFAVIARLLVTFWIIERVVDLYDWIHERILRRAVYRR